MLFSHLQIDPYAATPKYSQLANAILSGIEEGELRYNDLLPSINELSAELDISRDTVERCYKYLKQQKIIDSVPGKGYYIKSKENKKRLKIFLLFNKLSTHKKIIYDSFIETLGSEAIVDFYIYNNDYKLFEKIITERKEGYTHYVIIPHFIEGSNYAHNLINTLPKEKLLLLDKKLSFIVGNYASVYQRFEDDIYEALEQALERLGKYKMLRLIFPKESYYPKEIVSGFLRFCHQYTFNYTVSDKFNEKDLEKGSVYITVLEDDLVSLIEKIKDSKLKIGKDVGVISYNETPLKRIIMNGITTISTDFKQMGIETAKMIINNEIKSVEIPFNIFLRDSL
ncbi:MAG: GntR family transcriptional regulator [Arachidicoccus sp.]|nr:GntR family transcriptional regulator [Arachidicoccus sp.]